MSIQSKKRNSKIALTLANANKRKIESLESLIIKGKIVDYLTDVILWLVIVLVNAIDTLTF
jgi:hypothetical protein